MSNLLGDELPVDQILIDAIHGNKFVISAALLDLTVLHDNDLVCVLNGAKPMSDHDYSLLTGADKLVERLLDLMLTFSIES